MRPRPEAATELLVTARIGGEGAVHADGQRSRHAARSLPEGDRVRVVSVRDDRASNECRVRVGDRHERGEEEAVAQVSLADVGARHATDEQIASIEPIVKPDEGVAVEVPTVWERRLGERDLGRAVSHGDAREGGGIPIRL